MEKKLYQTPGLEIVELQYERMLNSTGWDRIDPGEPNLPAGANSRQSSIWGDSDKKESLW